MNYKKNFMKLLIVTATLVNVLAGHTEAKTTAQEIKGKIEDDKLTFTVDSPEDGEKYLITSKKIDEEDNDDVDKNEEAEEDDNDVDKNEESNKNTQARNTEKKATVKKQKTDKELVNKSETNEEAGAEAGVAVAQNENKSETGMANGIAATGMVVNTEMVAELIMLGSLVTGLLAMKTIKQ